jgi:hypothetical protein
MEVEMTNNRARAWGIVGRFLGWLVITLVWPMQSAVADTLVPSQGNFQISEEIGVEVDGKQAIVFDGTNFFAVWRDSSNIWGARVSTTGTILDPDRILIRNGSSPGMPSVAFDGTNFFIIWVEGEIQGARVSTAGVLLDETPIQVTTGGVPKVRAISLAFDGTRFLITWRTASDSINVARVTTGGAIIDAADGIPIGVGFYPWVAFDGTNFLVVWHAHGNGLDIKGNRVATDGTVLDGTGFTISSADKDQAHASVAFGDSDYLVVWWDERGDAAGSFNDGSARGVRVSTGGTVLDNTAIEIANPVRGPENVTVTFDGTDFFVVWMEDLFPVKARLVDVFGRRVSQAGEVLDSQGVPIATGASHQWGPRVGIGGDRYLAIWAEGGRCDFYSYSPQGCTWGQLLTKDIAPDSAEIDRKDVSLPAVAPESWVIEPSPTGSQFYDVWGINQNEVFASAESSHLYRFDGAEWSLATNRLAQRMWGLWASPGDVWAIGQCGHINHWDGSAVDHTGCHGEDLIDLWAQDESNIIVVGLIGASIRFDGLSQKEDLPSGILEDLWAVWGVGPDIHAVGTFGSILKFNGAGWDKLPDIPTIQSLNAIWGASADDLWVVGDFGTILHFNGVAWEQQTSGTTHHLFGVWGGYDGDIYAVGAEGTILRGSEGVWVAEISGTEEMLTSISRGGFSMWAVGDAGTILKKTVFIHADGFESD